VTPKTNAIGTLVATTIALSLGLLAMGAVASAVTRLDLRTGLLLGEVALVLPLIGVAAGLAVPFPRTFALADVPGRTVALAFLCGAAFWLLSAGVVTAQATFWPPPADVAAVFRRLHAALRPSGPMSAIASLLAIAVAPACAEELAFRGALLGAIREAIGPRSAVILSAVLFGAIHLSPGGYRVPFALLLGLALGALRLRTGSVIPGMIAHGVLNATTLMVAPFIDETAPASPAVPLAQALGLLVVGAVLAFGLMKAMPAVDSREP
jgi:membrane protease YdiL (CAAX protease family)